MSSKNTSKNTSKVYEKVILDKMKTIVEEIEEIAKKNTDDTKTENTKKAEACFTFLGVKHNALCEHGLQFFQCMECSH